MKPILLVAALLLTPALLTGCSNCVDSGICPFVYNGPTQPQGVYQEVTLGRGSTTRLPFSLTTYGVPANAVFELVASVTQTDPNLLAAPDDGRVVVRRLTNTFTGSSGVVEITVSADATLTTDRLTDGSFKIRRVGTQGIAGDVSIHIRVVAHP